ncbi:MAG: hypothetical protein HC919_14525 [Oscillatoriales cyanobacterium SM2_2_1]|nr:hypothetical protein [Oscillatoriales cyanobacterium SM2_2_1]
MLDLDEPYNTGFKSKGDREAFEKEGLAIARQMQAELGESYEIYYRDQPVRFLVENLEGDRLRLATTDLLNSGGS